MATGLWAKIHKWLALLMAVQILLWFASGLFFAWFPIERVRSEHAKAEQAAQPVPLDEAAAGLARLRGAGVGAAETVEVRRLLGRPVALVGAAEGSPVLYDLAEARRWFQTDVIGLPAEILEQLPAGHRAYMEAKRYLSVAEDNHEALLARLEHRGATLWAG